MFIIQNLTHPLTMKIFLNTLLLLSSSQPQGLKIYPKNKILNKHRKIHCKILQLKFCKHLTKCEIKNSF